jgi:hypothetical protein
MTRPKEKRINNKDRSNIANVGPRTRNLIECNCILHCNGSKLVDPRTFQKHQQEVERFRAVASELQFGTVSRPVDVGSSSTSMRRNEQEAEEEGQDPSNSYSSYSSDSSDDQTSDQEPIDIPTKRKRYQKFRSQTEPVPDNEDGDDESESSSDTSDDDSMVEDDRWLSDDEIPIEQFTAPDFNDFDFESDNGSPDANLDSNNLWIFLNISQGFVSRMLP